jgi:membrane fusion protein (multidrug efflux system)
MAQASPSPAPHPQPSRQRPAPAPAPHHAPKHPKRRLSKKKAFGIAFGVLFVVALGVAAFLYYQSFYEETDDAQIAAHAAALAAKVGGKVAAVPVEENQKVKAGQVLVQLDARDFENALREAQGRLAVAQAELGNARLNLERTVSLARRGAVPRKTLDDARSLAAQKEGEVAALRPKVDQAVLNLEETALRAPTDGRVGQKSVEIGMVVQAGQPLLNFVQSELPWVNANFKETQLKRIRVGQTADVTVDTIDETFRGRVESVSPGTGSEFAVIPPQNATGNFIKIVQRVPAKIVLDPASVRGFEDKLVAGSSVEVKVHVK